jgi:hypothetical protein
MALAGTGVTTLLLQKQLLLAASIALLLSLHGLLMVTGVFLDLSQCQTHQITSSYLILTFTNIRKK